MMLDDFETSLHCYVRIINSCFSRQARDRGTANRDHQGQKLGISLRVSFSQPLEKVAAMMNRTDRMDEVKPVV